MAFKKYPDNKLRRFKRNLVPMCLVMLCLMVFALGYGTYQTANDKESILIFLLPTVFGPLTFIPIIVSSIIDGELKKRSE